MADDGGQELDKRTRHVSFSEFAQLTGNFPCPSPFKIMKQVQLIHLMWGAVQAWQINSKWTVEI